MCISFYNACAVIGYFLRAMENMKMNHIECYHLSASGVVKPEYLQEAPFNFGSDKKNAAPFEKYLHPKQLYWIY